MAFCTSCYIIQRTHNVFWPVFGDPKRGLPVQELPARWPHCHILIHLFPKGLAPLILPNFSIPSGVAKWWLFLQSLCIYSLWFSINDFLLLMICYPEVQFIPAQQKKYFMFSNLLIHFQNSGLVVETSNDDQWIFVKVLVWIHGFSRVSIHCSHCYFLVYCYYSSNSRILSFSKFSCLMSKHRGHSRNS